MASILRERAAFEKRLGYAPTLLVGAFSPYTPLAEREAREAGYASAFAVYPGVVPLGMIAIALGYPGARLASCGTACPWSVNESFAATDRARSSQARPSTTAAPLGSR